MISKKLTFNYANLNRIPQGEHGIYVMWSHSYCLYVGKAERMTLKDRLLGHYNHSHNPDLNLWIQSTRKLEFQYETVVNVSAIDVRERKAIRHLAPLTNKNLR